MASDALTEAVAALSLGEPDGETGHASPTACDQLAGLDDVLQALREVGGRPLRCCLRAPAAAAATAAGS